MTVEVVPWNKVPRVPALYAMYGGSPQRTWVAYVGQGGNLAERLSQHLERRDSSVTTGVQAVGLNVDHVVHVAWWLHPTFTDDITREAAEVIAFRVLDPALRSRGNPKRAAIELANDPAFIAKMEGLFLSPPAGAYRPPRLPELADRIAKLEARIERLEGSSHGR